MRILLLGDAIAVTMNGSNAEPQPLDSARIASLQSGHYDVMKHGESFRSVPWRELSSLYLIRNGEFGLYKLGYSDDVPRRLAALQRDSAYQLDLVAEWKCPKVAVKAFESLLHDKLSHCRTHGEWFAIDKETLVEIEMMNTWSVPMVRTNATKLY